MHKTSLCKSKNSILSQVNMEVIDVLWDWPFELCKGITYDIMLNVLKVSKFVSTFFFIYFQPILQKFVMLSKFQKKIESK
jgi:hypothetical protein